MVMASPGVVGVSTGTGAGSVTRVLLFCWIIRRSAVTAIYLNIAASVYPASGYGTGSVNSRRCVISPRCLLGTKREGDRRRGALVKLFLATSNGSNAIPNELFPKFD
jgi:hypothetical protein